MAIVESRSKGIVHFDLSGITSEASKVGVADGILRGIAGNMRRSDNLCGKRVFIMLDEAWKLLAESNSLETILREGRKYRHGLIFSSQLMEDVDLALLSNAATLFAFRLQNSQSLERLARNYNLRACEIRADPEPEHGQLCSAADERLKQEGHVFHREGGRDRSGTLFQDNRKWFDGDGGSEKEVRGGTEKPVRVRARV